MLGDYRVRSMDFCLNSTLIKKHFIPYTREAQSFLRIQDIDFAYHKHCPILMWKTTNHHIFTELSNQQ